MVHTYAQGLEYVNGPRSEAELYAFAAALGRNYGEDKTVGQLRAPLRAVLGKHPGEEALPEPASRILDQQGVAEAPTAATNPPPRRRRRPRVATPSRQWRTKMRQFLMAFVVVIVVGVILLFATRWAWNQVFGHDEPLHDRITAAVDELDNDSSERQIRRELEDQDLDEDDAEMLAESISNALAEGVTVNEILDAIEDLDEDVSVRGVSREIDELVADMSPEDDESPTPPAEENGEQTDEPSTTPTPTPEGEDSEKSVDTGSMPEFVNESSQGSWTVKGSERLGDNPVVEAWISRLQDPAPELWKTYPNVPNPDVPGFRVVNGSEVPDGVEYGVANVPFCQQDTRCDFVVPGWHYRLITADYSFLGEECRGATEGGCLLLLINVGEETYTWRNQMADNGFSVPGRYWNGDALEWGVWGLVSHASANMLNMETQGLEDETLNSGVPANAGGNCGTVDGCDSVDVRVVVHAGDAVIAVLETEVTRP